MAISLGSLCGLAGAWKWGTQREEWSTTQGDGNSAFFSGTGPLAQDSEEEGSVRLHDGAGAGAPERGIWFWILPTLAVTPVTPIADSKRVS